MEKEFYTSHVIGVSAGSCNGVDYVSRQPGRTRDCMIHREKEYSYYQGVRRFLKDKSLLNMDMIFDRYPNEIYPFDYDTFFASNIKCEIVTTNCVTGKAEYMEEHSDRERLMRLCRASSSMPLVSPMVNIDGVPYLDGGVADSVPIRHALKSGNDKIIVVLTRNPGYRKKPVSKGTAKLYRKAYKSYPKMAACAVHRNRMYNRTMELVEKLEAEGRIYVIRPMVPTVSRLERDYDKLMSFYEHGYALMKKEYTNLLRYMEE